MRILEEILESIKFENNLHGENKISNYLNNLKVNVITLRRAYSKVPVIIDYKETKNQEDDFILGLKNFNNLADYITINISSPNTENLRDFHEGKKLIELLKIINEEKKKKNTTIPIMLKISPDINDSTIDEISEIAIDNSITALILTNTTNINRNNLIELQKNEIGGLSGKPLEDISNNIIKKFYKKLNGKIIIVGVGGVDSGKSAYNKIISGASLVQLYTGMIFKGPEIVKNIKRDLIDHLKNDGVKNFKEIIGQRI